MLNHDMNSITSIVVQRWLRFMRKLRRGDVASASSRETSVAVNVRKFRRSPAMRSDKVSDSRPARLSRLVSPGSSHRFSGARDVAKVSAGEMALLFFTASEVHRVKTNFRTRLHARPERLETKEH